MKLIYQPVKPFFISQHFGDNHACITLDGSQKVITCNGNNPPPGYRSLYKEGRHGALDLGTYHGQEVYASHDGKVYKIDTDAKSGLDVRIEGESNGVKFRTISEHLMGYQVKVDDIIKTGQLIGWADNTGYSSGDHLHFQMEIFQNGTWVKVDPLLYMEDLFALEYLKSITRIGYLKELLAKLLDRSANKIRNV